MKYDTIIAGAGACGLMAALELAMGGHKVLILEARPRSGGRIHSIKEGFSRAVDRGAEFIHGDLPLTKKLLKEAGIDFYRTKGSQMIFKNGSFQSPSSDGFFKGWEKLLKALNVLTEDISIEQFLNDHFNKEADKELRSSVLDFVEGFDAADATKASAFALRDEWNQEDEEKQYLIPGGYAQLTDFLEKQCKDAGVEIQFNSPVSAVHWESEVQAHTDKGIFAAERLIVTVPLGVLQAAQQTPGAISFDPPLTDQIQAIRAMGVGHVIKVLLEFKEAFWKPHFAAGQSMESLSFIFSDCTIPTWWTPHPDALPLLTGWIGGPNAYALKDASDAELLHQALESLAQIFGVPSSVLNQLLAAHTICNWTNDPYAHGAYSYATMETKTSRQLLNMPVKDLIYFAGEALYDGPEAGTVEAALKSGMEVSKKILKTGVNT